MLLATDAVTHHRLGARRAARGRGRARRGGRRRARAARPRGRDPHAPRSSRSAPALFTIVSAYGFEDFVSAGSPVDPTRIAAQIVTGIGFLGAGAIIRVGPLGARPDHGGEPLDRGRDRDGRRRRLLLGRRGRDRAHGVRARAAAGRSPSATVERLRPDERRLVVELKPGASVGRSRVAARRRALARGGRRARPARGHGSTSSGPRRRAARRARLRPRRRDRGQVAALRRARLASQNANKLAELQAALPGWEIEPLAADDWPEETGATYEENARLKARFGRGARRAGRVGARRGLGDRVRRARRRARPALGALGAARRPGRRAARAARRRAGPARADGGASSSRSRPTASELRGSGVLEGAIARERRGTGGFGYDPIFVPDGETRTVAELGDDWKREHSHRGRAARALDAAVRGGES